MKTTNTPEAALLSAMMYRPESAIELSDKLKADDFSQAEYSEIYTGIVDMAVEGKFIDPVTLSERVGHLQIIGELAASPQFGDPNDYAQLVIDRARMRKLTAAWAECNKVISDQGAELSCRVDTVVDILSAAVRNESASTGSSTGKQLLSNWYNDLEETFNAGGGITGIKTGFPDLDQRTKGLKPGDMVVVAARPGMGKTNLAINMAWAAARQNKSTLYFSLEMTTNELMHRFAAQSQACSYESIQEADFEAIGHKVANFSAEAMELPLIINDNARMTMASIRSECLKAKRRGGLDIVFIDHIGLISGKADSQYQKMTDISRDIKLLAKELKVPVVALTQLNRAIEQRADPIPKLSDLRDSGAIEQDADIIVFPYRNNDPDADPEDMRIGMLVVAKLRRGKIGLIPVFVQFEFCRFLSCDTTQIKENWLDTLVKPKAPTNLRDRI